MVKTAQAFRPHVMDMFEPQDHPDDIPYPGGPPTPPYDATGYTLAFQMGVKFDRILDDFSGPFVKLTDFAKVPAGAITSAAGTRPATTSRHQANDSFIGRQPPAGGGRGRGLAAERPAGPRHLLRGGQADHPGDPAEGGDRARRRIPVERATAPTGVMSHLRKLRIGLFDTYGGGMPSGWTRLIFENFEFPFDAIYPPDLDKGSLHDKYDVIVFNGAGLQAAGGGRGGRGGDAAGRWRCRSGGAAGGRGAGGRGAPAAPATAGRAGFTAADPEEFARRQGQTSAQSLAQINQFVKDGGTVIAIGTCGDRRGASSSACPYQPPRRERRAAAAREVLRAGRGAASVAWTTPIRWRTASARSWTSSSTTTRSSSSRRMPRRRVSAAWPGSPTRRRCEADGRGGSSTSTRASQVIETSVGKGRLFLMGPEVLFRSQPHGNYKLFFNGLYLSVAPEMTAGQ